MASGGSFFFAREREKSLGFFFVFWVFLCFWEVLLWFWWVFLCFFFFVLFARQRDLGGWGLIFWAYHTETGNSRSAPRSGGGFCSI